jgi:hypothetical protein
MEAFAEQEKALCRLALRQRPHDGLCEADYSTGLGKEHCWYSYQRSKDQWPESTPGDHGHPRDTWLGADRIRMYRHMGTG